jgi:rhodanese-related sulfurtransferase
MLKLLLIIHLVLIQSLVIHEVEKSSVLELVDEQVTLVDVRTDLEFERGTIAESINIDFRNKNFIEKISKLDKTKPYIVYCVSGNRSQKASIIMEYLGFKKIYHYKLGYSDWIKD